MYVHLPNARHNRCIDAAKVTSVFLFCGGNDIENLAKDSDIEYVYEDYEELVEVVRKDFPAAKINIVSLIPRRLVYSAHVGNMGEMNAWLDKFCSKENIRFVDIFSFFLKYDKKEKRRFLDESLFNGSRLHFNKTGDSVVAKVFIAVANRPR